VFEAGAKILFGAGKIGNGHLDSSRRCIWFQMTSLAYNRSGGLFV
jgi:hypothetical protein